MKGHRGHTLLWSILYTIFLWKGVCKIAFHGQQDADVNIFNLTSCPDTITANQTKDSVRFWQEGKKNKKQKTKIATLDCLLQIEKAAPAVSSVLFQNQTQSFWRGFANVKPVQHLKTILGQRNQ